VDTGLGFEVRSQGWIQGDVKSILFGWIWAKYLNLGFRVG